MAGELFPISNERELRERKDPIRLMIGTTINELMDEIPLGLDDKVNRVLGVTNKKESFEKYLDDLRSGVFDSKYGEAAQEMIMTTHTYAKYIAKIGGEAYLYEYDYPAHANHADDAYLALGLTTRAFDKDENEQWLGRAYPRYFANFINGLPPAEEWSPVNPQLMNYFSVNKSRTDNVFPNMEYGYQKDLVQYFDGIIEYDNILTMMKSKILNTPIQYKALNLTGYVEDVLESLTVADAFIFFGIVVGILCIGCYVCAFFKWVCPCCCRKNKSRENEPLLMKRLNNS